jgi:hypothetical protein
MMKRTDSLGDLAGAAGADSPTEEAAEDTQKRIPIIVEKTLTTGRLRRNVSL